MFFTYMYIRAFIVTDLWYCTLNPAFVPYVTKMMIAILSSMIVF